MRMSSGEDLKRTSVLHSLGMGIIGSMLFELRTAWSVFELQKSLQGNTCNSYHEQQQLYQTCSDGFMICRISAILGIRDSSTIKAPNPVTGNTSSKIGTSWLIWVPADKTREAVTPSFLLESLCNKSFDKISLSDFVSLLQRNYISQPTKRIRKQKHNCRNPSHLFNEFSDT